LVVIIKKLHSLKRFEGTTVYTQHWTANVKKVMILFISTSLESRCFHRSPWNLAGWCKMGFRKTVYWQLKNLHLN